MIAIGAFFSGLWARAQAWIIAGIAILIAIGVAFLKGRSSGKAVIIEEQKQQRADAIVERKQVDEAVETLPPSDVDDRLSKWMRD